MVGFSSPGALADYIVVNEKHCFGLDALAERLGDGQLACEVASLVEPAGCSYNGMFVAAGGMAPGSHVVVFGCGPIGLGAIALARVAGAATITAFETKASRRKVATALGADHVHDLLALAKDGTSPAAVIREVTKGWGADMVIEAAGAAVLTMPEIEKSLAPRGTMVYLGRTGERAPVMLDVLVSNAARIVGARGHAGGGVYPNLLRLLETGRMDLGPMITARFPLHEGRKALDVSRNREDAKIVLVSS
jgi:threonine dehydrogenase-like Zn-dependent dehydrogenase